MERILIFIRFSILLIVVLSHSQRAGKMAWSVYSPPIYFDPTEKSYYIWTVSQPTQPGISFVSASWSNQQQNNVRGGRRFSSFQTRLDIQSIQLPIFSQTFLELHWPAKWKNWMEKFSSVSDFWQVFMQEFVDK